ncbi:hypothetical protein VNO77_19931 [Canavalia gladiata]|uniref:Uncharacterized protein n=1 Tax=Canavalia gladiata TaxID=3824 RepID=A0AAN9QKV0_CANGL
MSSKQTTLINNTGEALYTLIFVVLERESKEKVLTYGDDPTLVISSHLHALGADCSHLNSWMQVLYAIMIRSLDLIFLEEQQLLDTKGYLSLPQNQSCITTSILIALHGHHGWCTAVGKERRGSCFLVSVEALELAAAKTVMLSLARLQPKVKESDVKEDNCKSPPTGLADPQEEEVSISYIIIKHKKWLLKMNPVQEVSSLNSTRHYFVAKILTHVMRTSRASSQAQAN